MRTVACFQSILFLPLALLLFLDCSKAKQVCIPAISAELAEEDGQVLIVLRNTTFCEFSVCTDNAYDAMACLDVRKYPDTAEFPAERVFGASPTPPKRKIITVSDYTSLMPGQEVKVPVNMRCIPNGCRLGDSVLVSVYFKNVDPLSCSKVEVGRCDKATQDYCKRVHFVPNSTLTYWAGEVRTPYRTLRLCTYAPPRPKARTRKASKEVVVRRSRTHPLKHKVF